MNRHFAEDLKAKFSELLANSPAKDIERNAKEFLKGAMTRMDMVTREEFDAQADQLKALSAQVAALESRVQALQAELAEKAAAPSPQHAPD